jgi:predicted ATPase
MTAAVVCSELSFSWPDGVPVLSGLTASFGPGRTGLIGVNGPDGARWHPGRRVAGTLSGGERFRAVLAALLLAQPAPQLLLLDEPTNNLDMASVRQLSQALEYYRGALIVASHDLSFLRSAGITRWLRLDRDTGLTAIEPR